MKIYFIVNPKAGKGKGTDKLIEKINGVSDETQIPVQIYTTAGIGDAQILADKICAENPDEEIRLIACGGDGTLNEVLNGAIKYSNATVGVVPTGTGNDFCRNFPEAGDFLNIEAQLKGTATKCDAIRYSGYIDGRVQTRYCANMFNIGFDCNVVDMTSKMKMYPLISGSFAYLLSVMTVFVKKKGAYLTVEIDGTVYEDGPVLLTSISNGCFCGGGIKSSPMASVHDGIMDINVIHNVKRTVFLKMFPSYCKGTYLDIDGIDKIVLNKTAKKAVVTPIDGVMRLCTDGEIVDAGRVEFEVVNQAFNFLVPATLSFT